MLAKLQIINGIFVSLYSVFINNTQFNYMNTDQNNNDELKSESKAEPKRKLTIFDYLKKIVTWQRVGVITGIAIPIVLYYCEKIDNTPPERSEIELLKDSIRSNVDYIESHFKWNETKINREDTVLFSALSQIGTFKLVAIELAKKWSLMESTPRVISYNDTESFDEILENKMKMYDSYYESALGFSLTVHGIDYLGKTNNYDYLLTNKPMSVKFDECLDAYNERIKEIINKIMEIRDNYMSKYENDSISVKSKELKDSEVRKAVALIEEMFSCIEYYRYNNQLFKFIIIQNKKYELFTNLYLNDPLDAIANNESIKTLTISY